MLNRYKLISMVLVFLLFISSVNYAWAGTYNISAQPENDVSSVILGAPLVWNNPNFIRNGLGLNGEGQVVGVADTGLGTGVLDTLHPDLRDKIIGVKDYSGDGWDDPFGHGTHIAATIAGSGAQSGQRLKGIAPNAELYFQATHNQSTGKLELPDLYSLLEDAYVNGGVRIHSNSWGFTEDSGIYDQNASSLDQFVWEHPEMLVLKSAGNFGDDESSYVTSPGSAKNTLTVGATESPRGIDRDSDNPYQVAAFSNRGTTDGRIKPDLVAPGTWVLSASRDGDGEDHSYSYLSGTSMSTALATGSAILTRQYFTDIKNINPSAALVKAALIHGAKELPGESRLSQGFGLIDLHGSLMTLENKKTAIYDNLKINEEQQMEFEFDASGNAPLKVTLVWSDYPQRPGANNVLVNDLDLKVTTPDGRDLWGNNNIGGDKKNNVEVVTIDSVQSKVYSDQTYSIQIKGSDIQEGPQPFSLLFGEMPLRGEVKFSSQDGKYIDTYDGGNLDVSSETEVLLVKNSKYDGQIPFKDIPTGTSIYYYPASSEGEKPQLTAVYDLAYAALKSRLKTDKPVIYLDTKNHWAEDVISSMSRQNILAGYPDGTFRPNEQVTRAQFASMLVRTLKLVESPAGAAKFHDVSPGAWYSGTIGAAVEAKLVAGYSEHTFAPNDLITREQMAVMIARALSGGKIPYDPEDKTLEHYSDLQDISLWARPSISLMVNYGITRGREINQFNPQGKASRAESAVALQRMLQQL